MGAQQPEIERELADQRQQVGDKLAHLRERLSVDARDAQALARRQTAEAARWTSRGAAFIAGALAVGFLLGRGMAARRHKHH